MTEEWCKDQKLKIALHFHECLKQESLGHRQTILRAFSLSVAGLLAVIAGIISTENRIQTPLSTWLTAGLFAVVIIMVKFMICQRIKSNEAINQALEIERRISCYCHDRIIPEKTLLPEDWNTKHTGVTRADILQFCTLVGIVVFVAAIVYFKSKSFSEHTPVSGIVLFSIILFTVFVPNLFMRKDDFDWPPFLLITLVVELAVILILCANL